MKRITLLLSLILLFALFSSCEKSKLDPSDEAGVKEFFEYENFNQIEEPKDIRYCGEDEVCLWAGQHIDAGSVIIGNDDENLYITIKSDEGFYISPDPEEADDANYHIGIYKTLPTSRPAPGQSNYKGQVTEGDKEITIQIPLDDINFEDGPHESDESGECSAKQYYVLVHAVVIVDGGGQTAYGGCNPGDQEGPGNASWWYYIDYYTQCCTCWCSFGNDYHNPDGSGCFSKPFQGTDYFFWSNNYDFADFSVEGGYDISLLVNSSVCAPQNSNGDLTDKLAFQTGDVVFKTYVTEKDGKKEKVVDVTFTLDPKYNGYNIQFDLYIGAHRVPEYDLDKMVILTDEKHMLYQHKVTPGEVTYTFVGIPWLTLDDSNESFISVHAAIGDCPMPSLQKPM